MAQSLITNTGLTSFSLPPDFASSGSTVECIGGGGGAKSGTTATGGSGGGAYAKSSPVSHAANDSVQIQVGVAGTASVANGTATWFDGASLAASFCGADLGLGSTTATGAAGGLTANCKSNTSTFFAGNSGGNRVTGGGGGGGAGGPNGQGGQGGASVTGGGAGAGGGGNGGGFIGSSNSTTTGGAGGNNYLNTAGSGGAAIATGNPGNAGTAGGGGGGAGGGSTATIGGQGGPGAEWGSVGSGGGGGGAGNNAGAGGTGGLYGGGGGGSAFNTSANAGSSGAQGIIVLTYTPTVANTFDMASCGAFVMNRLFPDWRDFLRWPNPAWAHAHKNISSMIHEMDPNGDLWDMLDRMGFGATRQAAGVEYQHTYPEFVAAVASASLMIADRTTRMRFAA